MIVFGFRARLASLMGVMLCCAVIPAGAQSQSTGEQILFAPPPGWTQVHNTQDNTTQLNLYVPAGQRAEAWSEAFVVRLHKGMTVTPPDIFLSTIPTELEPTCPELRAGKSQKGRINGYDAAFQFLECPLNKQSNRGEIVMSLAVQGAQGLYVFQRAWQIDPFVGATSLPIPQQTVDQAISYLHNIRICNPMAPAAHPC